VEKGAVKRERMRNDKIRLDKTIGSNIRRERENRKITRDEFAEILDLTNNSLGLIERGERGATSVTLEKVIKALNVSLDSLFTERSKAISVRERRESGVYRKKVAALISHLTETELKVLIETIKGIMSLRKADNSDSACNEIFSEGE